MLTKEQQQEALNRVVVHMAKQREPAHDSVAKACLYLDSATGAQCAIGCMLTHGQCIEADSRSYSIREIVDLGWNDWALADQDFLGELQDCHDTAVNDAETSDNTFIVAFDARVIEFCEDWALVHPGGLLATSEPQKEEEGK